MKPQRIGKDVKALLELSIRDDLIITPVLNEFVVKWDQNLADKAIRALNKNMRTKQRDRSASWSASGINKCMRRQEFAFLGMPTGGTTDAHLMMIFDHGTWIHRKWQAILMTAGILDSIELTVKRRSIRARCSMDGEGVAKIGRYQGNDFGFELKGRNDFQYNKQVLLGIDESTRAQVDFSFMLSGLDLWVVLNENKNNQQLKEWIFVRDDDRVKTMLAKVKELNQAIDKQRLHPMLPECTKQLKGGQFFQCPFGGKGGVCASSGNWPPTIPIRK